MLSLKQSIGYISLKEQYTKEVAKLYSKFEGDTRMTTTEEMDQYVSENWEDIDFDDVPAIVIEDHSNTMKNKDATIDKLNKTVEALSEEKNNSVKEKVAELEKLQKKCRMGYFTC